MATIFWIMNIFLNCLLLLLSRMFKFLKKLFSGSGEEETIREEIRVEDLESWFKGKSDRIFSELDVKIWGIRDRVKEEITKAKDNLAVLSTAKLHNPKITVREIQFMEGNRKSYILGVNSLLRGIELEKGDYSTLLGFCDDFDIRLDKFGKSTVRAYHILQEFFSHESRNIAINVKNLGNLIGELRKGIADANLGKINETKEGIVELNGKIRQKNELISLLADNKKVKERLIKKKRDVEGDIEGLIRSKEYEQLNDLRAKKESLLTSIRDHNAKVIHSFSVMERPLKKLMRVVIEDAELLERYIENPVEALVSDSELKIAGLLKQLESNITNLTLELKDKKREKVLETVKGLTEEFFKEFINKHDELDKRLDDIEKGINENAALKRENELDYELENVTGNLEKVNAEILGNEQELSKINIGEMKDNLEKKVNELFGTNVALNFT